MTRPDQVRVPPEYVDVLKAAGEFRRQLTLGKSKLDRRSVMRGMYDVLIANCDELAFSITREPEYFWNQMPGLPPR